MAHGMLIAVFRTIVLTFTAVAQVYLFVNIRRAVKSLPLSGRFKSWAVVMTAVVHRRAFFSKQVFHVKPGHMGGPPGEAKTVLVYASAVWTLGSILSALILLVVRLAGRLGRMAAGYFTGTAASRLLRAIRAAAISLRRGCAEWPQRHSRFPDTAPFSPVRHSK